MIAEIKQDNKQEITDLKQRHKALEDVDDIAGSYRDGWERMLEALEEEDFCRCLGKFRKEFEEIKNA